MDVATKRPHRDRLSQGHERYRARGESHRVQLSTERLRASRPWNPPVDDGSPAHQVVIFLGQLC